MGTVGSVVLVNSAVGDSMVGGAGCHTRLDNVLLVTSSWSSNGRASVGSVVGWSDGVVVVVVSSQTTGSYANSAELGVVRVCSVGGSSLWLTLPELALVGTGAGSVVVCWRWSETLLLLVMADESDLDERGKKEKECADDAHSECCSVESASKA